MTPIQRSILFSAIERYASVLLFFVSTAVLSRLLTPSEFGVFAVVNALTAVIAAAYQEFGGANYLIQKRDLSHDDIRSAFTVTFVLSLAVGVALYLLAGPISELFKQQELRAGIAVVALNFLLGPFIGTLAALFRRRLEFGTLAISSLAGAAAGSLVSIVLALLKFSYMAPIWGGVAGNVVQAIVLFAKHRDVATFRPSLIAYRDIVGFGLYSSGVSVINVFYNLSPQLFMARILDFASVGLYSRAVNITQVFDRLVTQVLNPVIMPAFAARRAAGEELSGAYLESARLLAAVQWPALLFIAIMAHPIISIWLGHNWLDIVPLVRVMSIANIALFAACLSYPTLVASGHVRDALTSSLISLPPSLLLVLGAAFFGVEAVAASALLTLPFQAAVAIAFISRRLHFDAGDLVDALRNSAIVALCSSLAAAIGAGVAEYGHLPPFAAVGLSAVLAGPAWLAALIVTDHPLLALLKSAAGGFVVAVRRGGETVPVGGGASARDIVESACNATETS